MKITHVQILSCLLGALVFIAATNASLAQSVPLGVTAKTHFGDSHGMKDPAFDDSNWMLQSVIEPDGWNARGASLFEQVMWQRLEFDYGEIAHIRDPVLHLGIVSGGHAIFINGVKIGAMALYDPPVAGHHSAQPKALPRVYDIPVRILRRDRPNVIAMKFARYVTDHPGVRAAPFEITERAVALAHASPTTAKFIMVSAIGALLYVLSFVASFIGYVLSPKGSGMGWLLVSFVCIMPCHLITTSYLTFINWVPNPIFHLVLLKLFAISFVPLAEFARTILAKPPNKLLRALQVIVIAAMLFPNYGSEFLEGMYLVAAMVCLSAGIIIFAILSVWSCVAAYQGQRIAWPLAIGICVVWLSVVSYVIAPETWFITNLGVTMIDIAIPVLVLCLGAFPAVSLFEYRSRLAEVQGQVLTAQEAERRRMAYDIHDGVGQWLSTIKLNLQMLKRQHTGTMSEASFAEVVDHVDAAISDTRRIAHDLSPAMIEKQGLRGAMLSHADFLSRDTNLNVRINAAEVMNLPSTSQGHLYRIFQEAVGNAIRHGKADEIIVDLLVQNGAYALSIQDNGQGVIGDGERQGLGLSSIRQRAVLLGARFGFERNHDAGMTLSVAGNLSDL